MVPLKEAMIKKTPIDLAAAIGLYLLETFIKIFHIFRKNKNFRCVVSPPGELKLRLHTTHPPD